MVDPETARQALAYWRTWATGTMPTTREDYDEDVMRGVALGDDLDKLVPQLLDRLAAAELDRDAAIDRAETLEKWKDDIDNAADLATEGMNAAVAESAALGERVRQLETAARVAYEGFRLTCDEYARFPREGWAWWDGWQAVADALGEDLPMAHGMPEDGSAALGDTPPTDVEERWYIEGVEVTREQFYAQPEETP